MSAHLLPYEITHQILTSLVAEILHDVCLSPIISSWEQNFAIEISLVCRSFREVIEEIGRTTFAITLGNSEVATSIPTLITEKLHFLRTLGIRARDPFKFGVSATTSSAVESHLISAYSLYISAINLRRNAVQTSGELFKSIHESIRQALSLTRHECGKIRPLGLAGVLTGAVEDEILMVNCVVSTVQVCSDIDTLLNAIRTVEGSTNIDLKRSRNTLKSISEALQNLQSLAEISSNILTKEATNVSYPYSVSKLPGVNSAFKRCGDLPLSIDEHRICGKALALHTRWSLDVGCPSPSLQ